MDWQRWEYPASVSEGLVTLSEGQFYGNKFRPVATNSFLCSEGHAAIPEREVPRHRHASSHFVLVVSGIYVTEARNQDRRYGPGTLIYNPTGTTHRDRFHMGRGRFLTITPSAAVAHLLDARIPVPLVIHDRESVTSAIRIHQNLVADERLASGFLEDCCLDFAGTISDPCERESRHVPSWLTRARARMRGCAGTTTVAAVARQVGIHPVHLARALRHYFHTSPAEYLSKCRIHHARCLLLSSTLSLAEIALATGYSDQSHFTHAFRRDTAITPAAYRRLHRA